MDNASSKITLECSVLRSQWHTSERMCNLRENGLNHYWILGKVGMAQSSCSLKASWRSWWLSSSALLHCRIAQIAPHYRSSYQHVAPLERIIYHCWSWIGRYNPESEPARSIWKLILEQTRTAFFDLWFYSCWRCSGSSSSTTPAMIRSHEGWRRWVPATLGCGGMWSGLFADIEVDLSMYVLSISSVLLKTHVHLLHVD